MLLAVADTTRVYVRDRRDAGLDRLRGLAIVVMILDHLLIVTGHETSPLRYTVTRAAMPLFFVLSGHLVRRVNERHLMVAALGVTLPLLVPFIDRPNVLLWYAACCPAVLLARRAGPGALAVLVLVPLTLAANGYHLWTATSSYDPVGLLGLMALGALLPRDAARFARRLPAWLGAAGRFPLTVYVMHLLILAAVWHALG